MLPLKDNIPTRTFPFITISIIIINSLIFLYQYSLGPTGEKFMVYSYGAIPYELTQMTNIIPFRSFPYPLSVFTAMFIHGNFLHIAGNMLYLWIFGDNIEDRLGHFKFIIFYLVCGLIGTIAHILTGPTSKVPMIGASGAIAGILGAYMFLYPKARVLTLIFFGFFIRMVELPALVVLGLWIIIQIVNGTQALGLNLPGGVAWFAHIGGFLAGILLLPLFKNR